jgi:hypothetical protein
MQASKIDINSLMTVKNYAVRQGITTSYIYKLVKEKKLDTVDIDGVKFVDVIKNPTLKR